MKRESVLGIYREHVFSPGKIQDDAAILDATLEELSSAGLRVRAIRAEDLEDPIPRPGWVLTMAQSSAVLAILDDWAGLGTTVVNSVASIRNCYRKPLSRILHAAGVPVPSSRVISLSAAETEITAPPSTPIWLKRGDVHAIEADDVTSVSSKQELLLALSHFQRQNVGEILIQDHVEGPVVKFYGVGRGDYFRAFQASTGQDITMEVRPKLLKVAQHAAEAVGLDVYGGDAVMTGGRVAIVDVNDWPSFSRCRHQAARSIAAYLLGKAN